MRVLITGATGLLGKYVVDYLSSLGHEVVAVVRKVNDETLPEDIEHLCLDISNQDVADIIIDGVDAIVHLASHVPAKDSLDDAESCFRVNSFGTRYLLELALRSRIKNFIYVSSIAVYGDVLAYPLTENHSICPKGYYGLSKYLGELFCTDYEHNHGMRCVVLRLSSVFGEGYRRETLLPKFVNLARRGLSLTVYGSGLREQDFVYGYDVAQVIEKAIRLVNISGSFNIGSGVGTSVIELAETVRQVFNPSLEIVCVEGEEDRQKICLGISKAANLLGYKPKYSLEEGLIDMKHRLTAEER